MVKEPSSFYERNTEVFLRMALIFGKEKADHFRNRLFLWCHQESNRGHKDFQSFALPTEL